MTNHTYLIQGNNIVVVINGKSHIVNRDTHPWFQQVADAIAAADWDKVSELVDVKSGIEQYANGAIKVQNGELFWNGTSIRNSLTMRIVDMISQKFPVDPLVNFLTNLMNNPSRRSIDELFGFLERNNLPITEDGHFLAFKKVRKDYLDIHSGTISNRVGCAPRIVRSMVDDNADNYCSFGLHFCSQDYLDVFGRSDDPVMVLKINPADVVSIPKDYNGAKGRCCGYQVVGEVTNNIDSIYASVVSKEYGTISKGNPTETEMGSKFRCVRESNGALVYSNLTYSEASAKVEQHSRNKKARLIVEKM